MRRHAKASSAGSTTRQAGRLGRIFRGAFVTRGAASRGKGSGAPTARLALVLASALLATLVLGVTLASAVAPTVTVEDASNVRYTTASVEGNVDPQGQSTEWKFQYATAADFSNAQDGPSATTESAEAVSGQLTGLQPDMTYHLRLLATNGDGTSEAVAVSTFTTEEVAKPTLTTPIVSSITDSSAHFAAEVDPNSPEPEGSTDSAEQAAFETSWHFDCSPGCGGLSGHTLAADNTAHAISDDAVNLQPNTEYTVTLHASSAGGEVTASETFTTEGLPPTLLAGTNTPELGGGAVLRGFVNPHNAALTDCHFAYSEDESFSQSAPCEPTPGAVSGTVEVEAHLTELEPGTTYHYRLLADNGVGGPVASEATAFEAFQEPSASTNCPNAATRTAQHSAFLPDCRAYEMVSPPDKNGGDVLLAARRTRVAADGNAYSFASLSGFGDTHKLYVGTDYLSQRSTDPEPGNSGWSTHGIDPPQATGTFLSTLLAGEPLYQGFFSEDLNEGIYDANLPLTEDENVAKARNLYLRTDLRTPGLGTYQLLTGCPLCAETSTPLSRVSAVGLEAGRPTLAGATPDLSRVLFEQGRNLTSDAPSQPFLCSVNTNFQTEGFFAFIKPRLCAHRVYESKGGQVRLVGRIPTAGETSCDDSSGPACIAADSSIAWNGKARENKWNPHAISDGSDGHSRIFFTQPTDDEGHTLSQVSELFEVLEVNAKDSGNLFVRTDGTKTEQINVSERTESPPSGFTPAKFLASNADGTRVFFKSEQALTDGAMHEGHARNLYMWSATPDGEGHHLTLIDKPETPGYHSLDGIVAISPDGTYAYFIDSGASLVKGFPDNNGTSTLYLWHSGKLTAVSLLRSSGEDLGQADSPEAFEPSAYVTDQGVLTYSSHSPAEFGGFKLFTGYESHCNTNTGNCRVLYDYNPQSNSLLCVSCDPAGEPAEVESTYYWSGNLLTGGTREAEPPAYHPIAEDGSRLFFTTQMSLVSRDTNGAYDAYEYDPATGRAQLLSSGTSEGNSFVTSEDGEGDNVFIGTRQQLVGWDEDDNFDIYDVRVGGGFPEPPATIAPCNGDSCRSATPPMPSPAAVGSTLEGPGNAKARHQRRKHRHRRSHQGRKHRQGKRGHQRTAKHNRRVGR